MTHGEFHELLSRVSTLSTEQLRRLRAELDHRLSPEDGADRQTLTDEESADQALQRSLFAAGLLSEIKPPPGTSSGTERFSPVTIEGEPLSETVIRERR